MNDQTKQQNTVPPQGNDQGGVQPIQQTPQPVQPVSGPHKEMAPLSGMTEVVMPTEQAPEIPSDLAEAGVEASTDHERPVIPQVVQQAGVTHAKENIVHHVEPFGVVQLPQMTQAQAEITKKNGSVKDAAKWFAVFVLRQFDKIAYQKLSTKS